MATYLYVRLEFPDGRQMGDLVGPLETQSSVNRYQSRLEALLTKPWFSRHFRNVYVEAVEGVSLEMAETANLFPPGRLAKRLLKRYRSSARLWVPLLRNLRTS